MTAATISKGMKIRTTRQITGYMARGDKVIGYPDFEVHDYTVGKVIRRNGKTRVHVQPTREFSGYSGCIIILEQFPGKVEVVG